MTNLQSEMLNFFKEDELATFETTEEAIEKIEFYLKNGDLRNQFAIKGHTLVLIGEDWQFAIDDLPELSGKSCIWQDNLMQGFLDTITQDSAFLHITSGTPHEESMDRYNRHIMLYDEVMAFTYFFSSERSLGSLNAEKKALFLYHG